VAETLADWAATPGTVSIRLFLNRGNAPNAADPSLNRALTIAARHALPVNLMCTGRGRLDLALQEVEKFLALPGLFLLSIPASVVVRWVALARQYGVSQSDIFHAQLAATMLEYGIRRIYTFNVQDVEGFEELEGIVPPPP
jgi:predicted nucleic acid-binding protein